MPGPLAAVLNVPDLGETSTGNAEELYWYILVCWEHRMGGIRVNRGRAYGKLQDLVSIGSSLCRKARGVAAYHDPVGEESFEGDTHDCGECVIVT